MTETPARPPPVVTYWAVSVWNSRTVRINAALLFVTVVPLLADPDLLTLIPARYLVLYAIGVKVLNVYLRTITTRPVAFIPPGDTVPVAVPKVGPPDPPGTGD
jgi:hypothetical protein